MSPSVDPGAARLSRLILALALCAVAACDRPANETPPQSRPAVAAEPVPPAKQVLRLPTRAGSIRFAAIGDSGRGDKPQYDVSAQMQAFREVFPYRVVLMLGDNIYDRHTPEDFRQKFELPYKPLLDAGVRFFAVIGNHDIESEIAYPPFNMNGQRYYTFRPDAPLLADLTGNDVQFFMLDTELLDRAQLAWLDRELGKSDARWKIPVFHRPIYTSGRYGNPAKIFRAALEPIFLRHGVKLALSGHEHFYERTTPQSGITYFISGAAGSLRMNDLRVSSLTASGFDTDYSFMLFEAAGDELHYQSIARTGRSVDYGVIKR